MHTYSLAFQSTPLVLTSTHNDSSACCKGCWWEATPCEMQFSALNDSYVTSANFVACWGMWAEKTLLGFKSGWWSWNVAPQLRVLTRGPEFGSQHQFRRFTLPVNCSSLIAASWPPRALAHMQCTYTLTQLCIKVKLNLQDLIADC